MAHRNGYQTNLPTDNPYTTGIAAVAMIALSVYFRQMSAIDAIQLLLTALLGAEAADALRRKEQ